MLGIVSIIAQTADHGGCEDFGLVDQNTKSVFSSINAHLSKSKVQHPVGLGS